MTEQTVWMLGGGAALAGLLLGWLLGRAGGGRRHVAKLEAELKAERARMQDFRQRVDAHFDRTGRLFASIAGSYKELFEHLSSGYDTLTTAQTRDRLRERIAGLPGQPAASPSSTPSTRAGAAAARPPAGPMPGVRQASSDAPPPLATRLNVREGSVPPAGARAVRPPATSAPAPAGVRPAVSAPRPTAAPAPAAAPRTAPAATPAARPTAGTPTPRG